MWKCLKQLLQSSMSCCLIQTLQARRLTFRHTMQGVMFQPPALQRADLPAVMNARKHETPAELGLICRR